MGGRQTSRYLGYCQLSCPDVFRPRLSLQRLFKLEQDVSQLPGAGRASVDILDDGQIVIHVAPGAEERVRQYLGLIEIER